MKSVLKASGSQNNVYTGNRDFRELYLRAGDLSRYLPRDLSRDLSRNFWSKIAIFVKSVLKASGSQNNVYTGNRDFRELYFREPAICREINREICREIHREIFSQKSRFL